MVPCPISIRNSDGPDVHSAVVELHPLSGTSAGVDGIGMALAEVTELLSISRRTATGRTGRRYRRLQEDDAQRFGLHRLLFLRMEPN